MTNFHFTGQVNVTSGTHTVTVEHSNVMTAAILAGEEIRKHFAAKGERIVRLEVKRVSAPAIDPMHVKAYEEGRKMGMTDAQIERFLARMA